MKESIQKILTTAIDDSLLFVCVPYSGQDNGSPNQIYNFIGPFHNGYAAESFIYGYITGSANIDEELPVPFVIDMNELLEASRADDAG